MEMMAHVRAWFARESTHTLLWDTLLAAVLIVGCVPFNVSTSSLDPGILFPEQLGHDALVATDFVPLMLRRYRRNRRPGCSWR